MNNNAQPSHQREDLKYGDPHLQRGGHDYYGPDKFAVKKAEEEKPAMESHGFYMADEENDMRSTWDRVKSFFVGDRAPH